MATLRAAGFLFESIALFVRAYFQKKESTIVADIKENVTVEFPDISISGTLEHLVDQRALVLHPDDEPCPEVLSVNLQAYGLVAPAGCVYIKDWSEGEGVADSLEATGLVRKVSDVYVGPFNSRAWLVEVLV